MAFWQPKVTNWTRTKLNIRDHNGPTTRTQSGKAQGEKTYELSWDEIQPYSPMVGNQMMRVVVNAQGIVNQLAYTTGIHNIFLELRRLQGRAPRNIFVVDRVVQYMKNAAVNHSVPDPAHPGRRIEAVLHIPAFFRYVNASKCSSSQHIGNYFYPVLSNLCMFLCRSERSQESPWLHDTLRLRLCA